MLRGKKICISSMTNLAVCFHGDGAHIIYFSPHFPLPFLPAHPFLFPLRPSHCIAFDSLSMRDSTVIRDIEPFRGKIHFALDLVFLCGACSELRTVQERIGWRGCSGISWYMNAFNGIGVAVGRSERSVMAMWSVPLNKNTIQQQNH